MSKIETRNYLSFSIWGRVSSAYPIRLSWLWECVLYLIIIKSEVWIVNHCLGLGHETMVCAVCLTMFSWIGWLDWLMLWAPVVVTTLFIRVIWLISNILCNQVLIEIFHLQATGQRRPILPTGRRFQSLCTLRPKKSCTIIITALCEGKPPVTECSLTKNQLCGKRSHVEMS